MGNTDVPYGDSLSYRLMCRYNSGFFFRHPLLDGFKCVLWRLHLGASSPGLTSNI